MKRVFLGLLLFILLLCSGCNNSISKELVCEENYILIDGKCVFEEVIFANQKLNYYCYSSAFNEQLVGTECVYYLTLPASIKYVCPDYYIDYGSECKFMYINSKSNCPKNFVEWHGRCYSKYVPATAKYYCVSGDLIGNQCKTRYSYNAAVNYLYTCPAGYIPVEGHDGLCSRTLYADPILK